MFDHVFVTRDGKNRFLPYSIVFSSLAALLGVALLFYNPLQGAVVLGILALVWLSIAILVRKYAHGQWHPGRQNGPNV